MNDKIEPNSANANSIDETKAEITWIQTFRPEAALGW